MRNKIIEYISNQYGADPEYLWEKFPDFAIFRHADNKKWFALIASVSRNKLGLDADGSIDVINLKINDPILQDELTHEKGIVLGYHMNKKYWISVMLDGTVAEKQIENLIDISFLATSNKKKVAKGINNAKSVL